MAAEYWYEFVAGWTGGCMGLLVGHPMDTLKVRQQTLKKISITSSIMNTFKYEGMRGFYKGMGYPLLATGALNSIYFGVYANTLRALSGGAEKPSYGTIFLAGCVGGLGQLVVACPVDLVKIKMQMQMGDTTGVWGQHKESHYKTPTACLQDLYHTRGLRGCYQGLGSMAIRDVPSFGLYILLYKSLVDRIAGSEHNASPGALIFCGGLAGVLSWASILPLDVIKSRIQADSPTNPKYKSALDCLVKSYKAEGIQVFLRGFWMMSVRAFPTNGAIFLGYEYSLTIMRKLRSLKDQS